MGSGLKWVALTNQSTTTMKIANPSEGRRPVIKSKKMRDQGQMGIGSRSRGPGGCSREVLFLLRHSKPQTKA